MKLRAILASIVLLALGISPAVSMGRPGHWPHWGHKNQAKSHAHISKDHHSYQPKDKHPKTPKNHEEPHNQ